MEDPKRVSNTVYKREKYQNDLEYREKIKEKARNRYHEKKRQDQNEEDLSFLFKFFSKDWRSTLTETDHDLLCSKLQSLIKWKNF